MKTGLAALLASAALVVASPAFAADEAATQEQIASAIDVAFGAAFTSQYVARGLAQTTGPAIQGYIEPSVGIFYVGVWASNVSPALLGAGNTAEIDVYGGIRPEFDKLSLDLGYAHYFYNGTGSAGGELYAKASYAFTDQFSAGAEIYHNLTNFSYGEINAEVSGLPLELVASGALGTDFVGGVNWNLGVSRTFGDIVTLDLRYHDHNAAPARFVATLSVDTSWSSIFAK